MVNDDVLWKEFRYEKIFETYYTCGRILHDSETCKYLELLEYLRTKPIYALD